MNELQTFNSSEFGQVRVINHNSEPWFVAKDVSEILGYSDTQAMTRRLDEDESMTDKLAGMNMNSTLINESGLYNAVLGSRKPEAKKFKKWVTSEVLPDIRKHGMYAKEELLDNPDLLLDVITKYKEERDRNKLLNTENQLLAQQNVKWADRKVLEALVKAYGSTVGFEGAWREFKKELLYMHGINLNSRITNYLNDTGKKTKPKTLSMIHDEELPNCISTAVAICKNHSINIEPIISKYEN